MVIRIILNGITTLQWAIYAETLSITFIRSLFTVPVSDHISCINFASTLLPWGIKKFVKPVEHPLWRQISTPTELLLYRPLDSNQWSADLSLLWTFFLWTEIGLYQSLIPLSHYFRILSLLVSDSQRLSISDFCPDTDIFILLLWNYIQWLLAFPCFCIHPSPLPL